MSEIVVGYEYFGRPHVIGEAPGPKGGVPLEGARRRIGCLIGLSSDEMAERFEWRNLLDEWPGYGPSGGSEFPIEAARQAAEREREAAVRGQRYILLGRRVGRAFGTTAEWFRWQNNLLVAPHPSGLSRWWNDAANVERARQFWAQESGL